MKVFLMKQGNTFFLKGVLIIIALAVLALCIFVLPGGLKGDELGYQPIVIGMYVAGIPFFIALWQAWLLLSYIDKNNAFSELSTKALKKIKACAVVISCMFAAGMPYIFMVADKDDAPGVVAIALVIIFASIVIATFAAVLQKLLENGMEIKSENDLTV